MLWLVVFWSPRWSSAVAPSWSTFTSPSTTETREPLIPLLTSKMVPLTDTSASGVWISKTSPALLGRFHHHRSASQVNRLAAPPLGDGEIAALSHLDGGTVAQADHRARISRGANLFVFSDHRAGIQQRRPAGRHAIQFAMDRCDGRALTRRRQHAIEHRRNCEIHGHHGGRGNRPWQHVPHRPRGADRNHCGALGMEDFPASYAGMQMILHQHLARFAQRAISKRGKQRPEVRAGFEARNL